MLMATGSNSLTTLPLSRLEFPLALFSARRTKLSASPLPSISNLSRFRPNGFIVCSLSSDHSTTGDQILDKSSPKPHVQSCTWNWRGYSIRYQCSGSCGPALVLVHGFGANSSHWRKNIPVLAKSHRVYAIDLIGYGYSDKPNPREVGDSFYTFETWASQLNDFCSSVVKDKAFFICNSIGGLVGLQAAVTKPQICRGILLLNISLRMLHITKQPWFGRPFITSFQSLLRNTAVGKLFFRSVATPESVRSILCQCYHDTSQVTEELVQSILHPGLEPGAVDVFLEFICYSGGPLPEELLPRVKCPVLIAWGDKDPWERIELGRAYGNFDSVEDFIILPDVGHCPQDEAPHLVNPLVESFVARHYKSPASASTTI
ncbi:PREDICTED: pheophytinase, chloroplastic isoform X3 [Theobroma cacao]|uniref:Pheophytinase, chloroplastic isoform X3 n=2 Tax=Theobroma cacao TaxID=3641 RepID=A0AB32URJ3_THECC|nr:PREDICTED: pheophytinase, chloroplastic isoform X3 [Theobroma cacao]EOY32293.1 Alpha/beta-Hydrolases superfamily protein isoform 2 [Theobroma cacao]